jgi:hypothetical protein
MRFMLSLTVGSLVFFSGAVLAQTWTPPADSQRCPSKRVPGPRGSGNHMKPDTVLRATRLIKTGEVFELGRVLSESMPMPAGRRFEVTTKRTRNDPGTNRRGSSEELVVAEIGQVGTQFDTFSHQMIGTSMYNCFTLEETATRTGFSKLGVEQVGGLVTRGVLPISPPSRACRCWRIYEIRPPDASPDADARAGRCDPHFLAGEPCRQGRARVISRSQASARPPLNGSPGSVLVGADNSAVEITPNPNPQLTRALATKIPAGRQRIRLLEDLGPEQNNRAAYEFPLIVEPLKIRAARDFRGAHRDPLKTHPVIFPRGNRDVDASPPGNPPRRARMAPT